VRPEVAVDIFAALVPGGGIGRYVRDLCDALLHNPDAPPAGFAYPRNFRAAARAHYPRERLRELPLPWYVLRALYGIAVRTGSRFDALFGEPAVLHSPVGYGPTFARTRLIAHVHDLTSIEHPEWHPFRANLFLSQTIPHAARHAPVVLTHSRFVAERCVAVLGIDPARIVTIPPPLSRGFAPGPVAEAREHVHRQFGIENEFILHVGTLEPRKNHVRLIGAFERMRRAGFPGVLVLVGREGWKTGPILARIEASPDRRAIVRITDVTDTGLVALYQSCVACAYPSLEEGFGMPLLESMVCGTACVTSLHPALLELGEGASVAVPFDDEDALARALLRLWRDPDHRAAVAAPGPARAAEYHFDRWAGRILALYRRELSAAGVT
jgi:glycosyltransferase involved in cell wall biosynthesis